MAKQHKHHPLQNIVLDEHDVARFEGNAIVEHLLDRYPGGLNALHHNRFSDKDWEQFNQLIGYSVSGWGGLQHTSSKMCNKADRKVEKIVNGQEK